jgi:ATP-dependent Clp protease ATP-binding subunit ClpC
VSMWEPFSGGARRAIVRAQEVAHMFGSRSIGTEHITFALAEGDDEVAAVLANALDRDAIRERLGSVSEAPKREMDFTSDAKRVIECAFVNARRLDHKSIGVAHIALGLLDAGDPPPLVPGGDVTALRTALDGVAAVGEQAP